MLFFKMNSFMLQNNLNEISEAQIVREKKNTLKYLKEAFETEEENFNSNDSKPKGDLQQVISKMKV
jgi:hypothetical protein